jgi:hypothetical protein
MHAFDRQTRTGRGFENGVVGGGDPGRKTAMKSGSGVEKQIAGMKRGKARFFRRRGSIWARVAAAGGTVKAVWVASAFRVVGLGQKYGDKSWCAVITFDDPDGFEQKLPVPFAELVRDQTAVIAVLARCGLMVNPTSLGRDLFCEFLMSASRHVETRISIHLGLRGDLEFAATFDGDSRRSGDEKA